jgi:hypothetical protein
MWWSSVRLHQILHWLTLTVTFEVLAENST